MPTKRSRPVSRPRPNQRTRKRRREMQIELKALPTPHNTRDPNSKPPHRHDPDKPAPNQLETTNQPEPQNSRLSKLGLWLGVCIGVGALIVAIYYGFWSYRMQKWQVQKDYHEWCDEDLKTIGNTTPACFEALSTAPKPPPFTKRRLSLPDIITRHLHYQRDDEKTRSYRGNYYEHYTSSGFPPGWKPVGWNTSIVFDPEWNCFERAKINHLTTSFKKTIGNGKWLFETILTATTTFLATIIFTPFIAFFWLKTDPAASSYHDIGPTYFRTGLLYAVLSFIFSGLTETSTNGRAFVYHVGVAGGLQTVLALLTRNLNIASAMLSFIAVVWIARRIQFRKAPRLIGGEYEIRVA